MMIIQDTNLQEKISKSILKYEEVFGGKYKMEQKYLLTGNSVLDEMLHGGYKKGTSTEISGMSDTGKTFLAIKAILEAQKENKITIYIDTTLKLTNDVLTDNNIDPDGVIIIRSNKADSLGPTLKSIIEPYSDEIGLIIIDDLAGLTTSYEQESSIKKNTDIHRSKVVKSLLMRISNLIRNTEITCLVINQERSNFDNEDIEVVSSFEK